VEKEARKGPKIREEREIKLLPRGPRVHGLEMINSTNYIVNYLFQMGPILYHQNQ